MGEKRWYIVGCYLSPDNTSKIESVIAALKERPQGAELLVVGYFNDNLSKPDGNQRGEDILAALAAEDLEDMSAHFLPLRSSWLWDRRTWIMIPEGREVRSRTDYIMGTGRRLFWNVSAQDPRYNSDHYTVMGCLRSAPLREHAKYLGGSNCILL